MDTTEWENLVLFNNKGAIVWQYFDYPTNTLLVGQQLYEDQKLIPSSSNLWACGLCFAALKLATSFVTYIGGSDGHLKIFRHSNTDGLREIVDMITRDLGECQHPHTVVNMAYAEKASRHYLVEVRNVSYFNLIDEDAAFPNISDIDRCREICLLNCSCGAVFFRYNNNASDGYCYIPSTLCVATEDFKERLGGGAFGTVFKGMLEDGTQIAAKRLDKLGQGMKEFFAEVETLGHVHHVNLVRLIAFCAEKSCRLLVYEYVTNGSIGKGRKKIILHIAKRLAYLHEECRQRIIHLHIKPQNILLDEDLVPKSLILGYPS
ncbi:uncharacterized protein LOC114282041 [Camellia sinensis]|uniref:uncharacterized protein LOC114282041 n=1 Tax=Camellia sinensis TaxID=4442 RepID=UPI001036F333|nr:uncharacterized protein LOC114282041 [Camellia sinensis]